MSKRLQVLIPDKLDAELEDIIKEGRFHDKSELIRSLIRDYLAHHKSNKCHGGNREKDKGVNW